MIAIHRIKLSRGSKSVTLYLHDDHASVLLSAAAAHGIHYSSQGYATARTLAEAWERFLLMRLALHEHHPPPLVPLTSSRERASHDLLVHSRAALDAILSRIRAAADLPSHNLIVKRLQDARSIINAARAIVERSERR